MTKQSQLPPQTFQDPNPTAGEVFPDGVFIELVSAADSARPHLLRCDGREQVIGRIVEHRGVRYEPRTINGTILNVLELPKNAGSCGPVRDILAEIRNLVEQFTGLPEKFTALIGRFVLASWIVDATQAAPQILIEGRDTVRARQLIRLLHCICRRALPLAAVSPAGFCALPSGMSFTFLVCESSISAKLQNLLRAATRRGNPIPQGGELRDLFGAQAIFCDAGFDDAWPAGSIRIPCVPSSQLLPALDPATQERIVAEYQPKLLAFRFSHYAQACATRFDATKLPVSLQEVAIGLAAATPGDVELQSELPVLLQEETSEIESANWVDPNTVIVEAILAHCREAKLASVYVGAIAEMAQKILEGRGESRKLDPGETGRRIKNLGFSTEPRDARGVKLLLTTAVCVRAHDLGHQLSVPAARECECNAVGSVGGVGEIY